MQGAPEAKDGKAKRSSPRCAWVDDPFTDELCSNFSLLALPQVFRVGISAFRRILWLLIFVAGFIASVVFTVKLVQDFLEYESATSVSIEGVDADGMIFPAVTVWNINPVRAGEVNSSTEIYESVCSLKPNINDELCPQIGLCPGGNQLPTS
ncbi:hypothetical protein BSKO_12205 [Bryopsis sp. KO-2023]|nr:hypothetical protein BSKO_12205 [Bryopsis sp. KO-2023]